VCDQLSKEVIRGYEAKEARQWRLEAKAEADALLT
jgi:hypothetical protein